MPPISVVIRAHVPDLLEAACRSVRWADDVVVVDSAFDDAIAAIARRAGARYLGQEWLGFAGQARFGMAQARHPWILLLDSDEECSPDLAAEIRALDEDAWDRHAMFTVRRRHYMFGRVVRSWEPDRIGRLLHRDRTEWPDRVIHERCVPRAGGRTGRLRGRLLHRRARPLGYREFFDGALTDERLPLSVEQWIKEGRVCRWYHVAFEPVAEFLKYYVLRLGFLDGQFGLLIAYKAAFASHLRVSSLWAARRGIPHVRGPWPAETPSAPMSHCCQPCCSTATLMSTSSPE